MEYASSTASGSASSPRSGMGSISTTASGSGTGLGNHDDEADVERFLKKMEMEKKMQALQQRLELASVKATNGWKDMSINEIETKLPPTPLRKRRSQIGLLPPSPIATSPVRGSTMPYEPPSPSRPWQLIDVLWQPLPPPSHGRYPTSPASPKKRSRAEDPDALRSHINGLGLPLSPKTQRKTSGHRRASSSISAQVHERERLKIAAAAQQSPSSPLRYGFEERIQAGGSGKKKRSTSHSTPRRKAITTSQDVDAAKALTFMLGSGGLSDDDISHSRRSSHSYPNSQLSAPLLPAMGSQSLPIPEAFQRSSGSISPTLQPRKLSRAMSSTSTSTPRPRPADLRTPNSHARSYVPDSGSTDSGVDRGTEKVDGGALPAPAIGEEDNTAAELMMFLAHSPSPMKRYSGSAPGQQDTDSPSAASFRPSLGAAARVLFADSDPDEEAASKARDASAPASTPISPVSPIESSSFPRPDVKMNGEVFAHSNLALAPPITPDSSMGPGVSPIES
ncbi:hypothetical protein I316_03696 [Kwoniella heveanensis BCC8398]|uniref:Uncharacterized protein n=1 Tax=Kwoniella heveanensis BCC8398 TaxID=1296120 RepID=A0A1B9GUE4_9TREE|nr:hypothetical protein I316_03696 [Kwoniella heveanensis BCC8398]